MGIIIPTTINIESMNIQETSRVYNILYKLQYISTSGVILKLEDISIMEYASYYKIIIKHKDSIDLLRNIERYLLSKIPDYRCAVKNNNSNHYITIKKMIHYYSQTTLILKPIKYLLQPLDRSLCLPRFATGKDIHLVLIYLNSGLLKIN